ncbi:MAG: type II toxin-antitoxin system HicB family antitoxin [Prevotella sp.]|jgi:predicted RNase H-like HicB family nuclease|nr:type II toxin-antitoxin system HicB family antitoxin [Prevotella sp.]
MGKLTIIVSGGKDQYGAWAKDVQGIYGAGNTLDEMEANIREAISLYLEYNENAPDVLKGNPELDIVFEASGLVKYYSEFISLPAMEKLTGVNQKQLWHYANGYKVPRSETAGKIERGLKKFAKRLDAETVLT